MQKVPPRQAVAAWLGVLHGAEALSELLATADLPFPCLWAQSPRSRSGRSPHPKDRKVTDLRLGQYFKSVTFLSFGWLCWVSR